jgi:hypothetical protein
MNGFPFWWECWNLHYPKMMSSQIGSQPISSRSSNFNEECEVPSTSIVEYNIDEGTTGMHINEGESRLLIKMT